MGMRKFRPYKKPKTKRSVNIPHQSSFFWTGLKLVPAPGSGGSDPSSPPPRPPAGAQTEPRCSWAGWTPTAAGLPRPRASACSAGSAAGSQQQVSLYADFFYSEFVTRLKSETSPKFEVTFNTKYNKKNENSLTSVISLNMTSWFHQG